MDGGAVRRFNNASNVAAGSIQESLFRDVALTLARLLDPPEQGRHENASVQHLVDGTLPEQLENFRQQVVRVRHKRLAHNDATAMREEMRIEYGFSDTDVDEAIRQIADIVNDAECAATDATTAYDYCEDQGRDAARRLINSFPD